MLPRPRVPMNNGMGPGMFTGRNPMMGSGTNPFSGRNPMMGAPRSPFGGGNPMMGSRMGPPQMNRAGGGLLSKILGGGRQTGAQGGFMGMQGASRAAGSGGGLLQSLSNPGGLTNVLNNTQQVLKTAQSIGPMIQQYGPMVKNLPAIWKIYRGFKNSSKSTDSSEGAEKNNSVESSSNETNNVSTSKKPNRPQKSKKVNSESETEPLAPKRSSSYQKGSSVPKMYI